MKVFLIFCLIACLVSLSLANHWGWGGEFGYKVKVHHPTIHGGWGWQHVGPSKGWTTFYDTHKKSPKGWGWWEEKKHKKHHHKHWW